MHFISLAPPTAQRVRLSAAGALDLGGGTGSCRLGPETQKTVFYSGITRKSRGPDKSRKVGMAVDGLPKFEAGVRTPPGRPFESMPPMAAFIRLQCSQLQTLSTISTL